MTPAKYTARPRACPGPYQPVRSSSGSRDRGQSLIINFLDAFYFAGFGKNHVKLEVLKNPSTMGFFNGTFKVTPRFLLNLWGRDCCKVPSLPFLNRAEPR